MLGKIKNLYRKRLWTHEQQARYKGVKIGIDCDIKDVSFGSEPYLVTVGNRVQIAGGTKIITHGGAHVLRQKYPKMDFFGKVTIKDNVYIGINCLIMPGVTIGSNVIVAAGSIVTKSVPDNVIVAGSPAKIVSSIEDFEAKMLSKNLNTKGMNYEDKKEYLLSLPDSSFIIK